MRLSNNEEFNLNLGTLVLHANKKCNFLKFTFFRYLAFLKNDNAKCFLDLICFFHVLVVCCIVTIFPNRIN